MRRSSRSHRRSAGKKRKMYWQGATFSANQVEMANAGFGETVSAWVKWPSGTLNFSGGSATDEGEGFPEQSDETLVRTISTLKVDAPVQGVLPGALLATFCFGMICWDATTVSAQDIDVAVNPSGTIPNPARDWAADWIFRVPVPFTADNFFGAPTDRLFLESRAMRKLPPRTGILGVFGYEDILAGPEEVIKWTWQLDLRMLFKQGYYQTP